MALIAYPDRDHLPEGSRQIFDRYPNNLVLMLAGLGDAFPPLMDTIDVYVKREIISSVLRELITLRIAKLFNADYVLNQHLSIAVQLGVSDEKLVAISKPLPADALTAEENAALLFIDALLQRGPVNPEITQTITEFFGESGLQEILLIFAMNIFLSRYGAILEIDLDEPVRIAGKR